jgi:hypothetical protein
MRIPGFPMAVIKVRESRFAVKLEPRSVVMSDSIPSKDSTPAVPPQPDSTNTTTIKLNRNLLITVTAIVLLASFFLPWTTLLGQNLSGLDIQKTDAYRFVWLMPLFAGISIGLNTLRLSTALVRRLAGISPFVILAYSLYHLGNEVFQILQVGAWLALVSGLVLVLLPDPVKPSPKT